jgi:pyruvate formate lyase activating enzyme
MYRDEDGLDAAVCDLCHHNCKIKDGGAGLCGARRLTRGGFESPFIGKFASVAVDPIEKKPLYHWRPGTKILSLGSVGCNFFCPFCQNHTLARSHEDRELETITPETLLETAKRLGLSSVAYTYNEPTLQAEYIIAAAPLLKDGGVSSAMVTNGAFSEAVRGELSLWVEAMNIDVKTFSGEEYSRLSGSHAALDVVKANVEALVGAGVHVELTNLVVPGISDSKDSFSGLVDWIAGVSPDIPLHISRYFPAFHYFAPPTDVGIMKNFLSIAQKRLKYVYLGNVW